MGEGQEPLKLFRKGEAGAGILLLGGVGVGLQLKPKSGEGTGRSLAASGSNPGTATQRLSDTLSICRTPVSSPIPASHGKLSKGLSNEGITSSRIR